MGDVVRVNFKTKVVKSVNGKPTGFTVRTRAGRKIGKATRMSPHEKIFHGATVAGAGLDYLHGRHVGLSRRQSASVAGAGAAIGLGGHHALRAAGVGWKVGLAGDVATHLGASYAQDRLRNHYMARNKQSVHGPRMRRSGKF